MSQVTSIFANRIVLAGALALGGFAFAERGTAQDAFDNLRGEAFGYLNLAVPVGEFGSHVDLGGGLGFGGVLFLGESRLAGLRAQGGFVIYGTSTETRPLSNTVREVQVEVQTNNSIFTGGLGPQVYLGTGPIRPYIYGTVGFAYFVTSTSVSGESESEPIATSKNFDDFQLSLTGGGGLSVEIRGGQNPISLDLSASYQHNGLTEYGVRGNDNFLWTRGGDVLYDPILSNANLMTYRVGASVGLG
ncbi:MAG: hypothetical protein OXU64_04815 [Gemmatimonadota bacterium]|nr:hypothetical protein [Gemmatimonadota bacterium]